MVYSDSYLHPIYIHICSSILDGDSLHHHNSNYVAHATILHQVRCELSIIQNLIVEEDFMFTRKEHSFFNDPYFKIVREEQQYIEVQSVSTGHCWNVFKNQFESTCKVKLYHKHKLTDQYYHEHRQCRTVEEAAVFTTVWNAIKTVVTTVINAIKTTVTTVFNAIKTTATTVWNAIKTAITTPINSATKNSVNYGELYECFMSVCEEEMKLGLK